MNALTLDSILAATDLTASSDEVVRAAAALAEVTGAELHVVHAFEPGPPPGREAEALPPGFPERIRQTEEALDEQLRRVLPRGATAATRKVVIYATHKAVVDRATEVSADLIVLGPHRGGAVGAHLLGTTADRVVRTAEVPCLVVRGPLRLPVRRIGVPTDLSGPACGALKLALAWSRALGGEDGPPELRLIHAGWSVEAKDDPTLEERVIRPELEREAEGALESLEAGAEVPVRPVVLWGVNAAREVVDYARKEGLDLLVMGTHGRGGVRRTLTGSVAAAVAREAPCPVLLVPPALWRRTEPVKLERVVAAVDFSAPSVKAAEWAMRHLAPEAEHHLVHVVDVPRPPAFVAAGAPTEEQRRNAREGARHRLEELADSVEGARARVRVEEGSPAEWIGGFAGEARADLVVVGEHGAGWGLRDLLGTTAERLLHRSPVPVLVARGEPEGPPRRILVPLEDSPLTARVLEWVRLLAGRSGATVMVLHVVNPVPYESLAMGLTGPQAHTSLEADAERWLRERLAAAELPGAEARVVSGEPRREILDAREESGADLVVMGSRGAGAVGRALLGSVAAGVVRRAPCPVLVVTGGERD